MDTKTEKRTDRVYQFEITLKKIIFFRARMAKQNDHPLDMDPDAEENGVQDLHGNFDNTST